MNSSLLFKFFSPIEIEMLIVTWWLALSPQLIPGLGPSSVQCARSPSARSCLGSPPTFQGHSILDNLKLQIGRRSECKCKWLGLSF